MAAGGPDITTINIQLIGAGAIQSTDHQARAVLKIVNDVYVEQFISTIGVDFKSHTIFSEGKEFRENLWPETRHFSRGIVSGLENPDVYVVCVSMDDPKGIEKAQAWISREINDKRKIIIAGLDSGLAERVVDERKLRDFAREQGRPLCLTETKTGKGFDELTRQIAIVHSNPALSYDQVERRASSPEEFKRKKEEAGLLNDIVANALKERQTELESSLKKPKFKDDAKDALRIVENQNPEFNPLEYMIAFKDQATNTNTKANRLVAIALMHRVATDKAAQRYFGLNEPPTSIEQIKEAIRNTLLEKARTDTRAANASPLFDKATSSESSSRLSFIPKFSKSKFNRMEDKIKEMTEDVRRNAENKDRGPHR